jgi:O-antigen ligase
LNTLIVTLTAGIRDLKFWVLALLPFLAVLLFGFSFVNSQIIHLPKQVQRSLAFIPGKWDAEMARNAAASNDYRVRVWTLWADHYFPAHPWLGRGFGFKSEWSKPSTNGPTAIDYRQEVEVGNIHNGLFATLDTFGIVGTIFFVVWVLRILVRTFRVSFRRTDAAGMALRFLALYLAVWIISYWVGALNVGSFLPPQFALASVFLRLQQMTQSESVSRRLREKTSPHDLRTELVPA